MNLTIYDLTTLQSMCDDLNGVIRATDADLIIIRECEDLLNKKLELMLNHQLNDFLAEQYAKIRHAKTNDEIKELLKEIYNYRRKND